jgi:hypothetical protein
MATKRVDALLELGDVGGRMVWKGVLRAVDGLVRGKPTVGEGVN